MSTNTTQGDGPRGEREEELVARIAAAWVGPGDNPAWHYRSKQDVRRLLPQLGRYLDELTGETQ